jgi:hypothetical protein
MKSWSLLESYWLYPRCSEDLASIKCVRVVSTDRIFITREASGSLLEIFTAFSSFDHPIGILLHKFDEELTATLLDLIPEHSIIALSNDYRTVICKQPSPATHSIDIRAEESNCMSVGSTIEFILLTPN